MSADKAMNQFCSRCKASLFEIIRHAHYTVLRCICCRNETFVSDVGLLDDKAPFGAACPDAHQWQVPEDVQ